MQGKARQLTTNRWLVAALLGCRLRGATREGQASVSTTTGEASQHRGGGSALVTSSPGSYWNRARRIEAGQAPSGAAPNKAFLTGTRAAEIVVSPGQRFQTWHGLGGTFNEAGWSALSVLTEAERARALRLLFDSAEGIGLSWGRIPIGASDYALDRYTHNGTPGDDGMTHFDLSRDEALLIPFIRAAQAVKADIQFWGSPWTPPPWMKTNGSFDGGSFDTRYMAAMARYLVRWIQAYESRQIPIEHVQPQNEPGWSQAYPSCAWGPSTAGGVTTDRPVTLGAFVEHELAPAIAAAGLDTKIWYGTLSNNATYEAYWSALSPRGRSLIQGVGLQWGTAERVAALSRSGLLVMQTEHRCGNYPWLSARALGPADANRKNFLASQAPNNHAYAEESWDLIKLWVEAGVNIYGAWNLVLDDIGMNMDVERPWPQNALLVVDRKRRSLRATPAYYVFRHIGQFVRPGAVRLGVEGGNALAFENPDASIATIVFNPASLPSETSLVIGDQRLRFEVPPRGWATVAWPPSVFRR